ncbi:MAG TPA: hypothetical protein P5274_01325 [Candidatus Paceibacterota bacterium]|nr:hypothetical protein [Candidatus Paceibacterota bacterium]
MKNNLLLKWALIIGIVIVLNLFFHFATKLVYDEPKFEDFCQTKQVNIQPEGEKACVEAGGAWNANPNEKFVPVPVNETGEARPVITGQGYCDTNYTCQKEFETAINLYNRNIFLVLLGLGLLSLIIGFALASNLVISTGLSYGGILSFIIGTVRYWSAMDDYLRVIILGLALVVLIWLGVKKFKD